MCLTTLPTGDAAPGTLTAPTPREESSLAMSSLDDASGSGTPTSAQLTGSLPERNER